MEFVAPGLIMMSIIQNSYANVVSSFFGSKFAGNVEEMLVAPVHHLTIIFGYVVGGMTRGLSVGVIVTFLALFFTDLNVSNWWVTISMVLLTSLVFSLAGFINAIFARNFDDISIIPTFVLTPMIYLGGVFIQFLCYQLSGQMLPLLILFFIWSMDFDLASWVQVIFRFFKLILCFLFL